MKMDDRYFIPPELIDEVTRFQAHLSVSEKRNKRHVLIFGDTGVGKSLFINVYKDFYRDKYTKKNVYNRIKMGQGGPFSGLH